jgi:hypothetical protein
MSSEDDMPSIKQRVQAFFNPPTAETTAQTPAAAQQSIVAEYEKLKADRDRLAIIKTCRTMYQQDPRVKKALKMYATDLVKAGFIVKTKNEQAKQIATDLQNRIGLNKKLQDVVRLSGRDGDSFYEIVVDDQLNITEVSRKPTLRMRRNSNSADKFEDPQRAFYMVPDNYMSTDIPKDAVWFAEWQIIHTRWEHDDESRYGTPMWASATGAFKRVTEGETDMAVRRKVRAGMRLLHVVEGSPADLEAYKTVNKKALDHPTAAHLDLFTNKPGSITAVQGDAHLSEINDLLHQVATMFAASDVPMELVAYGEGLNRDILSEKKDEYDESLADGREWVTEEFLKPLIERQWLMKGILPAEVEYALIWRKAKSLTPADLRDLADAGSRFKVLGVKDEIVQLLMASFLRDVDIDILNSDGFSAEQFAKSLQGISI